jgi:hypothetical protein
MPLTLQGIIQEVCPVVGVVIPQSSVFANLTSNRTMQEMIALANEIARRIAYDSGRDWQALKKQQVYTGDGVTTAFNLPADYKRMLLTSSLWRSTSTKQPMTFYPDTDEWLARRAENATDGAWGEWTLLGGQVLIEPVLPVGVTARFAYLDRNCIRLHGTPGANSDTFQNDDDTYRLDDRLLKLGMIWQWKAQKGSPYAEDMGTFSDALAMEMGHDQPSPIIIGRRPMSHAQVQIAYPWPVPTP